MEVGFNENQSEIDMCKMEQEVGLDDDSGIANTRKIQNEIVIEMEDVRTLELFKGGKDNIMVASGGLKKD